ncbi:hypothetical protein AM587_10001394 [Phytophthora nicotianae]|uniref:Uncharacterized protein n=1 Tax=Phytophthora nicotianae TaxID=4792 RepID=A0A0W8CLV4_PHYNI|nr:hypothetical protein AM587_10001394 [Phytophthora nicotianae]
MSASTPRVRFNWEDALAQDRDLQQIDAFVKLTISKLPGQPAASADAGRGSRYQPVPPAVKTETPTTMVTTTSASNGTTNGSSSSGGSTPQLINVRDYLSESSSEVDTREIADKLAADPKKSNLLLIHACNCDDVQCTDPEFHRLCPHMKRFLRSVCWASHSDKWRTYRLAQITADLFAYHANNCTASPCNVPLCLTIREEEIV